MQFDKYLSLTSYLTNEEGFDNFSNLLIYPKTKLLQGGTSFISLLALLSLLDGILLLVFLFDSGLPNMTGLSPDWYVALIPYIHPLKVMPASIK